jgi:hypothetical protein
MNYMATYFDQTFSFDFSKQKTKEILFESTSCLANQIEIRNEIKKLDFACDVVNK